ncbi:MAG TPA: hypothetical protein DDZ36_11750, partial [Deltaproteobacteria bacterium]|nr:hypothetical protein [Deltaproteobacteria bacterium]
MKNFVKKLNKNLRLRYYYDSVFGMLLLGFVLGACSSTDAGSNYNYPTGQQQRVLELCALVFTDPYYQYISPSRRVKLK